MYSCIVKASRFCYQCSAGAAGTAGTVLAVPLFSRFMIISRRGLHIHTVGGVWHPRGGAELTNVYCIVRACSSKWPAAHVSSPLYFFRLLTSRLPDSLFLSEPSVRRILCGVPSSGRGLISCTMTRRMTLHTASFPRRR